MKSGIYKITNLIDGKFYIGSSKNIKDRLRTHLSRLRRGVHPNSYLQNAFNKYKEESFIFEKIKDVPCEKKQLLAAEQQLICELKPSYNLAPAIASETPLSRKEKEENVIFYGGLKPKCNECGKEIFYTSKLCNHCARSGENNPIFGKPRSEETKKKISEHHKLIPKEKHPFFGKTHSEESRSKISKSKRETNPCRKPVKQIDPKTDEVIKIWESAADAYRFIKNKEPSSNIITKVCNKEKNKDGYLYKTAYGFKWEWAS